jgi:hypothetical protein
MDQTRMQNVQASQHDAGETIDSQGGSSYGSEEMWSAIDRRHQTRCDCGLAGFAKSIEQTRPQPVQTGGSFPVTVSDFSPQGARLQTPHELGVGDQLEITVETPGSGEPLRKPCRVIWTGQTAQQQWCAGVEFEDG